MSRQTAIIVVQTYSNLPPLELKVGPHEAISIDLFSRDETNFFAYDASTILETETHDYPSIRNVTELLFTGNSSAAFRTVRDTLQSDYTKGLDDLADTIHRVFPNISEKDYEDTIRKLGQRNNLFSSVEKRIQLLTNEITDLKAKLQNIERVGFDTNDLATKINKTMSNVATTADVTNAMHKLGALLNTHDVSTNLANFHFRELEYQEVIPLPAKGIQKSMEHDFTKLDFGLPYTVLNKHSKMGTMHKTMGENGSIPGLSVGVVYHSLPSPRGFEYLFHDHDVQPRLPRDASPTGSHVCFIRFLSSEGSTHVLELVEGYDQKSTWYGFRSNAQTFAHFFDDMGPGIQLLIVGFTHRTMPIIPSGHERFSILEPACHFKPRPSWVRNRRQLPYEDRLDWLESIVPPLRETLGSIRVPNAAPSISSILSGETSWKTDKFTTLPYNTSSPMRHNIEELLSECDLDDVVDALKRVGEYVGDYARDNLTMPNYVHMAKHFEGDVLAQQLIDFKAFSEFGMPKSDHLRTGQLANFHHYTRDTGSTIMSGKFGDNLTRFFCPSCACAYNTKCAEQLCAAIDAIVCLNVTYDDGIFGAILCEVDRRYIGGQAEFGNFSSEPIRKGSIVRCPIGTLNTIPTEFRRCKMGGLRFT